MNAVAIDDHEEADRLLSEWGVERARIQAGGYPTGHESVGGDTHSDRTFATVSRLNHLLAVDNAVGALPKDHRQTLVAQYVLGRSERKAAAQAGMKRSTWRRMRNRARLDFLWQYRLALWRAAREQEGGGLAGPSGVSSA